MLARKYYIFLTECRGLYKPMIYPFPKHQQKYLTVPFLAKYSKFWRLMSDQDNLNEKEKKKSVAIQI